MQLYLRSCNLVSPVYIPVALCHSRKDARAGVTRILAATEVLSRQLSGAGPLKSVDPIGIATSSYVAASVLSASVLTELASLLLRAIQDGSAAPLLAASRDVFACLAAALQQL